MDNPYPGRRQLYIVGYPRNGNTWLARLLGEALDSPVTGPPPFIDGSLATEGRDRPGTWHVIQAHLFPSTGDRWWLGDRMLVDLRYIEDRKIVLVVRDPRDVMVSVMHNWKIPSLDETLDRVIAQAFPTVWEPWPRFYEAWIDRPEVSALVRYEDLHARTKETLLGAVAAIGETPRKPIEQTVYNQSFAVKRAHIAASDGGYTYGKEQQLHHMRRGIVGDWRNHFTEAQADRLWAFCGDVAERLGYQR